MIDRYLVDGEDIQRRMLDTAMALGDAVQLEVMTRRQVKDAEDALQARESEVIAEAAINAKVAGEGPLAGLAATGPAYKAAMEATLARERRNGLRMHVETVADLRREADQAQARREQLSIQFSALKHAADWYTTIIRATTE